MNEVVLYGRAGCCLCDDARRLLLHVRDDHGRVVAVLAKVRQRRVGTVELDHGEAVVLELADREVAHEELVLDDHHGPLGP